MESSTRTWAFCLFESRLKQPRLRTREDRVTSNKQKIGRPCSEIGLGMLTKELNCVASKRLTLLFAGRLHRKGTSGGPPRLHVTVP